MVLHARCGKKHAASGAECYTRNKAGKGRQVPFVLRQQTLHTDFSSHGCGAEAMPAMEEAVRRMLHKREYHREYRIRNKAVLLARHKEYRIRNKKAGALLWLYVSSVLGSGQWETSPPSVQPPANEAEGAPSMRWACHRWR